MDKHRQYILTLVTLILLGMSVLVAAGEQRIGVYLSVFAIVYFATAEIFKPRRRWLDLIGIFLFIAFCILVTVKAMQVLGYW